MPQLSTAVEPLTIVITIGDMPVRVNTTDPRFLTMMQERYAGYVSSSGEAEIEFDMDLTANASADP